ncbi:MAG: GNAT family N-acetyltransferase [Candidatus Promineifilaceae bacterium]|nr:GNAT family N-acetyltransferase [Candidatus Promineifilaceae bacterium]
MQTRRIGFRHWRVEDLALAVGLWGDYRVTRLIDARGPLSRAQIQEKLEHEIAMAEVYGVQYWPIFLLSDEEHIGCCGLRPYALEKNIYEIGFHIRAEQWGQGFATEAAQRVIAYAFEELNTAALFAGHNPLNVASSRLLKKLGFYYTQHEYYPPTGLDHPSYLMTAEEYRAGTE